jgi:hypothetical protein
VLAPHFSSVELISHDTPGDTWKGVFFSVGKVVLLCTFTFYLYFLAYFLVCSFLTLPLSLLQAFILASPFDFALSLPSGDPGLSPPTSCGTIYDLRNLQIPFAWHK